MFCAEVFHTLKYHIVSVVIGPRGALSGKKLRETQHLEMRLMISLSYGGSRGDVSIIILITVYMYKHHHFKLIILKYLSRMDIFPKDILLFKQVMRTKQYTIGSSSLGIVILEDKPAAQNCYFCSFKL